jgi:protein-S-isoprenylcysteine O-methyltransferase Ste14
VLPMRAIEEERTLRAELSGYDAYMTEVTHRIVPGVW